MLDKDLLLDFVVETDRLQLAQAWSPLPPSKAFLAILLMFCVSADPSLGILVTLMFSL